MADQLIECVPNFSEGQNKDVIDRITAEIMGVDGVRLLDVDKLDAGCLATIRANIPHAQLDRVPL